VKIGVLIKQVPSSEARIRIGADGRSVDPSEVQFVVNPYDEYAMEAALQLREKFGGEVIVLSAGSNKAEEVLRTCLALGADRAILVKDDALASGDSMQVAGLLAAALRTLDLDLVLCGKVSIDHENSAVGVQVAALLGLPHVSVISKLEPEDERHLTVHREIEGGMERIEVDLPALVTANKGLNEPRYASLKGIMAAKKKPLDTIDRSALGLDPARPGVNLIKLQYPAPRAAGKLFREEARQSVRQVLDLLQSEAKVL
jgi:electron transfer flavoprotein beta subunit